MRILRHKHVLMMGLGLLTAACGKDEPRAPETTKAATSDADAAVKGSPATNQSQLDFHKFRAEEEARLSKAIANLKERITQLEKDFATETEPKFQAANQKRLQDLQALLAKADQELTTVKSSAQKDWTALKEKADDSMKEVEGAVDSAIDREAFRKSVVEKMKRVEVRIEALKADAAKANAEAKKSH